MVIRNRGMGIPNLGIVIPNQGTVIPNRGMVIWIQQTVREPLFTICDHHIFSIRAWLNVKDHLKLRHSYSKLFPEFE